MMLFSQENFKVLCLGCLRCVTGLNGEGSELFLKERNAVKVLEVPCLLSEPFYSFYYFK